MKPYHKIITVWKRDPENNYKTLIEEEWATPEFDMLQNIMWEFTEKIDGTNIRVIWDGETVQFGGKTDRASFPPFLADRLKALFPIEKMQEVLPVEDGQSFCLYGEGFGAKIQKGGGNYIPDGVDFILFDVFAGMWLQRPNVYDIADKLEIRKVSHITTSTLSRGIDMLRSGELSKSSIGNADIEGWIARPEEELMNRRGGRIITKLKAKDFWK